MVGLIVRRVLGVGDPVRLNTKYFERVLAKAKSEGNLDVSVYREIPGVQSIDLDFNDFDSFVWAFIERFGLATKSLEVGRGYLEGVGDVIDYSSPEVSFSKRVGTDKVQNISYSGYNREVIGKVEDYFMRVKGYKFQRITTGFKISKI